MPKEKYILDKNCFYHASLRHDHKNQSNHQSYALFANIATHCDTIIFDDELLASYWKIMNKLKDTSLLMIWNDLTSITAKTKKWDQHFSIKDDEDIKIEDRVLVSLARSSKATLITGDLGLIEDLDPNQENLSVRFKIKVLTPKEANLEIYRNTLKEEDSQKTDKKQDVKKKSKTEKVKT